MLLGSQKVGIKCPILYYEETYNTQNQKGLRLLDDPFKSYCWIVQVIK